MEKKKHIVLFPSLAQGHIIPFLSLANLINRRYPGRFTVTLVSTPLNVQALRRKTPPQEHLRFRELPFSSSDHGLPPNCESTATLRHNQIILLFHSFESLKPYFRDLIRDPSNWDGGSPLCIIADVFLGWTVEIARELAIFHAVFTTCGAYGTASYFSLWLHLPHVGNGDAEFHVPGFPPDFRLQRSQMSTYMKAADGEDSWSVFFRRQISLSLQTNAMLCNTAEELEMTGMRLLRGITGLTVWPVGPIISVKDDVISTEDCVQWLGLQPRDSVVYVCFGSQNTLSTWQTAALADGLEASGARFVWVVRPPIGFALDESEERWLPEGFRARMRERNRGVLVRDWAPQLEILSHGATGAFLSHCGWNSTLESLSWGVPMIGWPLAAEQFYNSKMVVEELGAGVELARGVEERVAAGEVERVIRLAIEGREGAEMRRKAAELSEKIKAAMMEEEDSVGSSIGSFEEFIRTAEAAKRAERESFSGD